MPIADTDIHCRFSGGAGNSDPNASLGGAKSSTSITDNTLHNLFDVVSGAESTSGNTEYRGFYVHNNHGSLTMQSSKIWIDSESVHTGVNVRIGLDLAGLNGTMDTIADEDTAPSPAVTFSEAATEGAALSLGNIPFSQHYGIWLERIINAATAAFNNYTVVIKVKCDTAA
jgi:hypothetical protein